MFDFGKAFGQAASGFAQSAGRAMQGWQQPAYDAMYKGAQSLASQGMPRNAVSLPQGGTSGGNGAVAPQGPAHGFYAGADTPEAMRRTAAMAALDGQLADRLQGSQFDAIRSVLQTPSNYPG